MKDTFGQSVSITLFGESHGSKIGCVLSGLAPGIKIDTDHIRQKLSLRQPGGTISTKRREPDAFEIVSGVFEGHTTGTPIAILIPNTDTQSKDYASLLDTPRPGHADYTAQCKYHGYQDYRGGGHFSGRVTAPIVAAGAILQQALEQKGIQIGTHIARLHGIPDRNFADLAEDIASLSEKQFPVLSDKAGQQMLTEIEQAAREGDSVGGVLESAVIGIPAGVGEPWFDSMESVIAHILFSVPAVKGVEFGGGFALSEQYGSQANDSFAYENGKVVTKTNQNGGINGGITNGMPLIVRTAIKPTPSIYKEQETVSLKDGCNTTLQIQGRHDPAIVHRARAVVDACLAIAVADLLAQRYGTDYLKD